MRKNRKDLFKGIFLGGIAVTVSLLTVMGSASDLAAQSAEESQGKYTGLIPQPTPAPMTAQIAAVNFSSSDPRTTDLPETTEPPEPTPPPTTEPEPEMTEPIISNRDLNDDTGLITEELEILCIDSNSNAVLSTEILQKYISHKVTVEAPRISGYEALEKIQSTEMKKGGNQMTFYYTPQTPDSALSEGHIYGAAFITGDAGGAFRPDEPILRGEALQMLYDYLDIGSQGLLNTGLGFNDISEKDELYRTAVIMAMNGIIDVEKGGSFRPAENITLGEFAYYAVSVAGLEVETGDSEAHIDTDYIESLYESGLLNSLPRESFDSDSPVTRAEAVVILNALSGCPGVDTDSPFTDVPEEHWAYKGLAAAAVDHTH